jgi:hypothetical protein
MTKRAQPGPSTLRLRFWLALGLLALAVVAMGLAAGDPLASLAGAGMVGTGITIAVLALDRHRFFDTYRLGARQRRLLTWLIVMTAVAFVLTLAFAVAGFFIEPALGVACFLGIVTGAWGCVAHLRRLPRTGSPNRS